MESKRPGFNTRAIHSGKNGHNPSNALRSPVFMTSTFCFGSLDQAERAMSFESDDYVYTRGNNPTIRELEECISELEEGMGAVAFSSGMAPIS
jgi:methionine-gamma-lyase